MKLRVTWFGFNSVYLDVWHRAFSLLSHSYFGEVVFFPVFCQWNGNEDTFAVLYFVSLNKTSSFHICWFVGFFSLPQESSCMKM